jgi:hypothetical protein
MGLRKGKGVRSGVGACVRAGGVLEWPWLWADVQVEGGADSSEVEQAAMVNSVRTP